MIYTTLELCKKHGACESGYKKLAKAVGGVTKYGKSTPIALTTVLESNGIEDCLWAFRATPNDQHDRVMLIAKTFAIDCAEQCLAEYEKKYPSDTRPRDAIIAARAYLVGSITKEKLDAARSAAWSAARSAAESAAWSAARSAASAAWSAARSAAWSAARQWQANRLTELLEAASE